jgi:MFS family permease
MSPLEANILKFYLLEVLLGFTYFYNEILVLYYQHFYLTYTEISSIIITTMVTMVVLEVPTGAFADVYKRKYSLFISGVLGLCGFTMIAVSSLLPFFIIASLLLGVSAAFSSGADNALIYDTLKELKREKEYLRIKSRKQVLFLTIGIVAAYFGPYSFSYNVRLPYYISAAACVLLTLGVLSVYEPVHTITNHQHFHTMKKGLTIAVTHKEILWLIIFSVLATVMWRVMGGLVLAPYIIEIGFTIKQLGVISVIATSMQTVFTFYVDTVEAVLGENRSFVVFIVLESVLLLTVVYVKNYAIAFFLGIFWSLATFMDLVVENYINRHLHKESRATVLSVHSMVVAASVIVFFPVFGFTIDRTCLSFTIVLLTGILFVGGSVLLLVKRLKRI